MKKFSMCLAVVVGVCLLSAAPVIGQDLSTQIEQLKANNKAIQDQLSVVAKVQAVQGEALTHQGEQLSMILSTITRQKADNQAMSDQLTEVSSKLDAVIAASKVKVVAQPSATWGGPSTFVATTAGSQPVPAMAMSMTSGYSSSAMTCAGGSCGSGAGRMRLFGRGR